MKYIIPPRQILKFFRWYCHPKLVDHIEGDLIEIYNQRLARIGKRKANIKFAIDVLLLFRPGIIRPRKISQNVNHFGMYKSYFKIGWRTLLRTKGYSAINIGGLAAGMTVTMLIGLWVYDELSFNKYHANYDNIVQLWHGETNPDTEVISGGLAMQFAVAGALKDDYQHYFKHVIRSWWTGDHTLATADTKYQRKGKFMEPAVIEVLSLRMLKGNYKSLEDPKGFILSESTAAVIFGTNDPIGKTLRIDNGIDVHVTGVYEDIPANSTFGDVQFIGTFQEIQMLHPWIGKNPSDWENTYQQLYAQLQPNVTVASVNSGIRNMYFKYLPDDLTAYRDKYKPFIQVVPMSTWHLYSEFEDGKPAGGRIVFVWLFGIIGGFVLLLACINFINLSTARSEKRAHEVGVRKTVGSSRPQLVAQFLSESFVISVVAFLIALALVALSKDAFNEVSGKSIALPFNNINFWATALLFLLLTTLLAGLYPAFFLSSFRPVKVLKGSSKAGRLASLPRKILVVVQFAVSTTLIIGTLVVYQQVQYARDRPVGYNRQGLISVDLNDQEYRGKQNVLRTELLATGVVQSVSFASSPVTAIWASTGGYDWKGRDPNFDAEFAVCQVTPDFGKTLGWKVVEGRDFSTDLATDTLDAVILNQAAVKYMGWEHAAGETLIDINAEDGAIRWSKTIIGVVEDLVMESPYEPVRPTIFYFKSQSASLMNIRIDPAVSAVAALPRIESVVKSIVPSALFSYKFVDDEYAAKFSQETRIGTLAGIFSMLAIFISCLGLFGLASFVAEQRTKEIGIRKVMGASVTTLWGMLSKDFVVLVIIGCIISIPGAWYFMSLWLERFEYRTEISWWIFAITALLSFVITILTVSYQSIRAARMNPVNSLRSE
ncbi:MAG TPA: FtsX-like permease family protein [Chryseolinea sp.]